MVRHTALTSVVSVAGRQRWGVLMEMVSSRTHHAEHGEVGCSGPGSRKSLEGVETLDIQGKGLG